MGEWLIRRGDINSMNVQQSEGQLNKRQWLTQQRGVDKGMDEWRPCGEVYSTVERVGRGKQRRKGKLNGIFYIKDS